MTHGKLRGFQAAVKDEDAAKKEPSAEKPKKKQVEIEVEPKSLVTS